MSAPPLPPPPPSSSSSVSSSLPLPSSSSSSSQIPFPYSIDYNNLPLSSYPPLSSPYIENPDYPPSSRPFGMSSIGMHSVGDAGPVSIVSGSMSGSVPMVFPVPTAALSSPSASLAIPFPNTSAASASSSSESLSQRRRRYPPPLPLPSMSEEINVPVSSSPSSSLSVPPSSPIPSSSSSSSPLPSPPSPSTPIPLDPLYGFDPDLFLFKDMSFIQALLCPICSLVARNPVEANNGDISTGLEPCCHISCQSCALEWLRHKQQCPTCRQSLKKEQLRPAIIARRLVADAKIRCLYHHLGCEWKGEIGKDSIGVENHMKKSCPFAPIDCPFDPLHEKSLRKEMNEHIKVCPSRLVKCDRCQMNINLNLMEAHSTLHCEEGMIRCPNECFEHYASLLSVEADSLGNRTLILKGEVGSDMVKVRDVVVVMDKAQCEKEKRTIYQILLDSKKMHEGGNKMNPNKNSDNHGEEDVKMSDPTPTPITSASKRGGRGKRKIVEEEINTKIVKTPTGRGRRKAKESEAEAETEESERNSDFDIPIRIAYSAASSSSSSSSPSSPSLTPSLHHAINPSGPIPIFDIVLDPNTYHHQYVKASIFDFEKNRPDNEHDKSIPSQLDKISPSPSSPSLASSSSASASPSVSFADFLSPSSSSPSTRAAVAAASPSSPPSSSSSSPPSPPFSSSLSSSIDFPPLPIVLKSLFPRRLLSLHLQQCPFEKMDCGYKKFGCEFPLSRRHLVDSHLRNEAKSHLNMANKKFQELESAIANASHHQTSRRGGISVPSSSSASLQSEVIETTRPPTFYHGQLWRNSLVAGDLVDCVDTQDRWYLSIVRAVTNPIDAATGQPLRTYLIHYAGWSSRWDEHFACNSPRISPPWSRSGGLVGSAREVSGVRGVSGSIPAQGVIVPPADYVAAGIVPNANSNPNPQGSYVSLSSSSSSSSPPSSSFISAGANGPSISAIREEEEEDEEMIGEDDEDDDEE